MQTKVGISKSQPFLHKVYPVYCNQLDLFFNYLSALLSENQIIIHLHYNVVHIKVNWLRYSRTYPVNVSLQDLKSFHRHLH